MTHPETALIGTVISVLRRVRIPIVILENSPTMKDVQGFDRRFARLGYDCISTTASAFTVGLPQRRTRWYAVYALKTQHETLATLAKLSRHAIPPVGMQPARTVRHPVPTHLFNRRYALLGRAIIPTCAQPVISHLARQMCTGVRGFTQFPEVPPPCLHLVCQHGRTRIEKQMWPTPRSRNPGTCNKLNVRISGDLPSAVKFEVNTPPGQLNLTWVEWLQGFPKGWTRCLA